MKICLVSNLYPPIIQGGAEIYVGRLAKALAREHRVVVVTSEPGVHAKPRREVSAEGIAVYRLGPINVAHLTTLPHHLLAQAAFRAIDLYQPQVSSWLRAILADERPDLLHVHNWVGLSLAAIIGAASRRLPVVMTLHDYSLFCAYASIRHPDGHSCRPDFPCRFIASMNLRLTSRVGLAISPSKYALDQHLRRGFFRFSEQAVLPNGLDATGAHADPGERVPKVQPKSTFDVLYMSRVQFHKGPELLIRAFRSLPAPDLRLHIAGTGPSLDACRGLASGDERIRIYGFTSGEVRRALMENADCQVLPSLWPENYPVSIQEAFQGGPAVVASRIGGIPEMVRDGVNGLLVEPGDLDAIATAIKRLHTSPELRAQLRSAARETARLYDMDYHVQQLNEAYRRVTSIFRAGDFLRPAA